MTQERNQASFNIRELTYYLDGGEAATKVNTLCPQNLHALDERGNDVGV